MLGPFARDLTQHLIKTSVMSAKQRRRDLFERSNVRNRTFMTVFERSNLREYFGCVIKNVSNQFKTKIESLQEKAAMSLTGEQPAEINNADEPKRERVWRKRRRKLSRRKSGVMKK